jgi:replicative DNA helicase
MLKAEKNLLSILINDPDKITSLIDLGLSEAMFSYTRPIYSELLRLYHANEDVSYELLMAKLPTHVEQIVDIMTDGALTVNPAIYAEQLIGNYLNEITRVKNDVIEKFSKLDTSVPTEIIEPKELIYSRIEYYDGRNSNKIPCNPFQTGFKKLDRVFETMNEEGTYIVLAARTTTGKTTLALNIGLNAALAQKKVIMFSVEMSQNTLTDRYLCLHADLSLGKLKNNMFTEEEHDLFYASAKEMSEHNNFRICSTVRRDWARLEDLAIKEHRKGNLDLLIIDYLQQFRYRHEKQTNLKTELSEISARIQEMKNRLKIPILVLVQPSREYNQNKSSDGNIMHHIKECGDIENDADIILHLKRVKSQKYNDDTSPKDDGLRELCIEKNKLGKQDFGMKLDFNLITGRFREYEVN